MSWIIKNCERYNLFMKKRLLTSALILTLASVLPANAKEIKGINQAKISPDLKEIVLGENQIYDASLRNELIATDTSSSKRNQPVI